MLDVRAVVEITGLSRSTIFKLFGSGDVPSFQITECRTSKRYTLESALRAWMATQASAATAPPRPARGRRARPQPKTSAAAS